MRLHNRRAERGISSLEMLAAGALLAVGITGMAVTVIYQRNLQASTKRLWKATAQATAELEQIRSASTQRWSSLRTDYNGQQIQTKLRHAASTGLLTKGSQTTGTATDGSLLVSILDDNSTLTDAGEMWPTGSTAPAFYAVDIGVASAANEFGGALRFQTYVADRSGAAAPRGTGGGTTTTGGGTTTTGGGTTTTGGGTTTTGGGTTTTGGGTTPPQGYKAWADVLAKDATGVTVSGTQSENLNLSLTNESPGDAPIIEVKVKMKKGGDFQSFALGGVTIYDGAASSDTKIDVSGMGLTLPPGPTDVAVGGDPGSGKKGAAPFKGAQVEVEIKFLDGSKQKLKVKP